MFDCLLSLTVHSAFAVDLLLQDVSLVVPSDECLVLHCYNQTFSLSLQPRASQPCHTNTFINELSVEVLVELAMQWLVFKYLNILGFSVDLDICFTEDRSMGCAGKYLVLNSFAAVMILCLFFVSFYYALCRYKFGESTTAMLQLEIQWLIICF